MGVLESSVIFPETPIPPDEVWNVLDRKSTRLNSSHLVISYAVFCLKKKKIKFAFTVSCELARCLCSVTYPWSGGSLYWVRTRRPVRQSALYVVDLSTHLRPPLDSI